MSVEIKVPMLPESVSEAVVATWLKNPGDACQEGDVIAELETDKVMLEVVATVGGVLNTQLVDIGDTVTGDQVLAIMEEGESSPAPADPKEQTPQFESKADTPKAQETPDSAFINASPSVRRTIHDQNIEVSTIQPTGRGDRYLASDLSNTQTALRRVKMSRIRAKIAERLVEAQHTSAMLTTFNEVNMAPVMALRSENQERFQQKFGIKLGFMSFFVQAVTHALADFPEVNASIDGDDVVYPPDMNIGIAVSTDRGLVVPVLKQAQNMGYAEIESEIKGFAQKARDGKITLDDMSNGTFTITNGGVFGSMLSTPILNMPQSAILGMHAIQKRAVVDNDEIVIRPMMYLALSYDHRLIDGQQSVRFLVAIKEIIENPNVLLLDI